MPRGIPKNKNLNNIKKELDNKNDSSNLETKISENTKSVAEIDESDYTVDPLTGKKYLKPKGDSTFLGQRSMRIPTINRPGYVIIWAVTRGNEIGNLISQGWDFVDPATPGCEEALKTPHGGVDQMLKPIVHRAMQMPIEKYNRMMAARANELNEREQSQIYNVKSTVNAADQKGFYVGKENTIGQGREHGFGPSSGMTSGDNVGFTKSMK